MALSLRAPGSQFDLDEASKALAILCDQELAHEVRGLPTGASVILPGSDPSELAAAAANLAASNNSVYLCLNPVALECRPERAVKDEMVHHRRWLMVDIDPVKPSEHKDDPATSQEKAAVMGLAGEVQEFLTSLGWPEPLVIDSGNGAYLLYRVDMANDPHCRELVKGFLWRLDARFSSPRARIDKATHNAARIAKIPGASSRKRGGQASPSRPYRLARVVRVPDRLDCVTEEQIGAALQEETETLDTSFEPAEAEPRKPSSVSGGLKIKAPPATTGGTSGYGRAALDSACHRIRTATPGGEGGSGRNSTLFREAAAIAELVAGGEIAESDAMAELVAAAREVGLDEKEIIGTFNSACGRGTMKPRSAPRQEDTASNGTAREPPRQPSKWRISLDGETLLDGDPAELSAEEDDLTAGRLIRCAEMVTLGGMMATDYPEPNWVVPGIMSEGLNILAGAPKKGKSILALNLALTIAGGGEALGKRVVATDVLYLSLEDKHRRIKHRAIKMLSKIQSSLADSVQNRLTVATDWPRHDEGGIHAIDLWRNRVRNPGLVIIDTWARFSPAYKPAGSTYAQDSDAMAAVQRYVNRYGFTALIVHHTRKASVHKEPDDHVQEVSGTLGLTGVADGILVLIRTKEDRQANLHITGRDVSDQEYILEFCDKTLVWSNLGTKREHVGGRVQSKIVAHLKRLDGGAAFTKDIASMIGENENSVRQALNRMYQDHIIRKVGNAWAYPGESGEEEFV